MGKPKRSLADIESFWEKLSTGADGGRFGAHSDQHITDLESWYVINYALKRYEPDSAVDVGCGNGDRTKLFSKYVKGVTLGLDYSEGMIALARKKESNHLRFQQIDILKEPSLSIAPDMIISCRCLINLGTQTNVIKALRYFHRLLPTDGTLVLCECSKQGHSKLNKLRKQMGLKEIQTVWHNINLDEKLLQKSMKNLFEFHDLSRLGVYYLLTRVLYPATIKPKDPNPSSDLNTVAAEIQRKVGIGVAEEYGRQYCVIGTKTR